MADEKTPTPGAPDGATPKKRSLTQAEIVTGVIKDMHCIAHQMHMVADTGDILPNLHGKDYVAVDAEGLRGFAATLDLRARELRRLTIPKAVVTKTPAPAPAKEGAASAEPFAGATEPEPGPEPATNVVPLRPRRGAASQEEAIGDGAPGQPLPVPPPADAPPLDSGAPPEPPIETAGGPEDPEGPESAAN